MIRIYDVCKNKFETRNNSKVCSENCRTIRDEKRTKEFREKYKYLPKKPKVDVKLENLDSNVLHKAQMTVDEYNRTHGTNYSYGQYVHFVERNLSANAESPDSDNLIEQMIYLRDVKKLSWTAVAVKIGNMSPDACRMAVERYLVKKGV